MLYYMGIFISVREGILLGGGKNCPENNNLLKK